MTRGRAVEAVLAWLAAMAALLPLTALFDPPRFIGPIILVTLTITVVGILLRLVTTSATGVLLGQLVIGFLALTASQGRGHLWHGLPSPDLFVAWNNRLLEAIDVVSRYAAPAPSPPGIVTALTMIAGVVVLVVDQVAVTRRSPAAAALPLLTAFLVSAANNASGVNVVHFLLAALAWLALVARQGSAQLRRWGPPAGSADPERDRSTAFYSIGLAANGRRLAVAALALAVLLPMVLPHFPQRYLADGLSRSGVGGRGGEVTLSDTLDVSTNLRDRTRTPVLTYRVNGSADEPLRVAVYDQFDGTRWFSSFRDRAPDAEDQTVEQAPGGLATERRTFRVTDNKLARPGLALPGRVVDLDADDKARRVTGGVYRAEERLSEYTARFDVPEPTEAQLTADSGLARGSEFDTYLATDPASAEFVGRLVDEIAPPGLSAIEQARRFETYLRGSAFTYSLDLAGPVEEEDGERDNVTQFLMTKRGFCLQFATAMIEMSRTRGIPARLVTGFLPGRVDDDEMKVVAADAHAWPELWFPGTGWLRFEPTPGVRSGSAPDWALAPTNAPTTGPTTGPTTSGTSAPTTRRSLDTQVDERGELGPQQSIWQRAWTTVVDLGPVGWVVILLVLGLLGSLALPLLAEMDLRRRRARATSDAERVEVEWQSLVSRLGDLGIRAPRGSTPRQAADHYRSRIRLDAEQTDALRTVVAQLETARYAAPGAEVADIGEEAQRVGSGALREASLRRRLRAVLLPSRARRALRESVSVLRAAPGTLWQRVRESTRRH